MANFEFDLDLDFCPSPADTNYARNAGALIEQLEKEDHPMRRTGRRVRAHREL